jgi:hypothetical protein
MAIEESIYSLLSASSGVTALCPAARIKPPGDYQALPRPYVVHRPIVLDPLYTHDSPTTALLEHVPSYQINIVAADYPTARALATAVRAAICGTNNGNHSGVQFFLRNEIALTYDTDRKIQEIAQDYEIFY